MNAKSLIMIIALAAYGCAYFESSDTYSSEAVRQAELGTTPKRLVSDVDYIISLKNDSIRVIDPSTGTTVLAEKYDSKSTLAEAMLKDNL